MRLLTSLLASAALLLVSTAGSVGVQPGGPPAAPPDLRSQLADPKPLVRLQAALALVQQFDEQAVGVLIDLLAELPPADRRQAEQALQQLAGDWAPNPPLTSEDEISRKLRRAVWAGWWQTFDGPTLLAAFRQRTLTDDEAIAARALIDQLGDRSTAKRERASAALIAQGIKVVGLLRAARGPDAEHARRVDLCLKEIAQADTKGRLSLSAPRLLAVRKPVGAAAALLGYLPFTDDPQLAAEIIVSLTTLARTGGKEDVAILSALSDPLPVRRSAAAEALAGAGRAAHPALRKLLTDADPAVRLRVARALVHARHREAVPALIALLPELPPGQVWEAEELLQRLAGDKAPAAPPGDDVAARTRRRDVWQAWWKEHGARVDLAGLDRASGFAGLTVVAEITAQAGMVRPPVFKGKKGGPALPAIPGGGKDRLVALTRDGKTRWQIEGLNYPMDFQLLPGGRVLIAEYFAKRVTERDTAGKIRWEVNNLPGAPTNVQRLANGHTFIAMYNNATVGGYVMEVDRAGKTLTSVRVGRGPAGPQNPIAPNEGLLIAAHKTAGGHTILLFAASTSCLRVDAIGKEIGRFPIGGINSAGVVAREGNIDVTSKGHLLVMQNLNTVTEFDTTGKVVWQARVPGHRATRLANGNTLVASQTGGVVELDQAGQTVWRYQPPAGYQAVRARRAGLGH